MKKYLFLSLVMICLFSCKGNNNPPADPADWFNNDTHFSTFTGINYRWSGDTIRYGSGYYSTDNTISYNITDTTYYLVVRKD